MKTALLTIISGILVATGPAFADIIKLENESTDRCLNIHGGRADHEGGRVTSYSCADTPDQKWELMRIGGGDVKLKNMRTDRCLNIHRGRHDFEGGPVTSYSCADTPDQKWHLIRLSNGNVKLKNEATDRCLNIHRGRHDFQGGPATSYSCADTPDQEWELTRLTGGVSCRGVEAIGGGLEGEIIGALNDELAGETKRINRRKTLRINRVENVSFDGCEAAIRVDATLKRRIRRNAHGPVVLKATVASFNLRERTLCVDDARVSSVRLSHTTRLGEAFYGWIANKALPNRRCFTES